MKIRRTFRKALACLGFAAMAAVSQPTSFTGITPGAVWPADDGVHIDAHGGNILYDTATRSYYWYGEHYGNPRGISCYRSKDLYNWSKVGVVFLRGNIPVLERPKVVYNPITRKYVMWFHYDDSKYTLAHLGVAVSDSLQGPFTMIKHFRPNGHQSRDIGMFSDDDGKVYILYAADSVNKTIRMVQLSADYQDITANDVDLDTHCEGPGMMKYNGIYYLITSKCTGWNPNQASYYTATKATGPYTLRGDPCVGDTARTTFNSQSCFIFKVPGYTNGYMYMGDRWNGSGHSNSRYVFLPIDIPVANTLQLKWRSSWNLSIFNPSAVEPGGIMNLRGLSRGPILGPDGTPLFKSGDRLLKADGRLSPSAWR